jgi:hypothetical protein
MRRQQLRESAIQEQDRARPGNRVVKAVQKGTNEDGGRALNGSLAIQGLRGMNVPTNLLGKLRQKRKLGEPQLPG